MTAKISQHVVPRQYTARTFASHVSSQGTWHIRQLRSRRQHDASPRLWQRGSVTPSTITLTFVVLAFVIVAMLGFVYLQQVFTTASQGSDMQALESKIVDLREQQRQLELEGAELRSMQAVEQHVQKLNLVTVDQVAYLAPQPDKVALVLE